MTQIRRIYADKIRSYPPNLFYLCSILRCYQNQKVGLKAEKKALL